MISRSQWKAWKPSPEQIRATETVFLAMAHTETVRPIVEGYQRRILEEEKYSYSPKQLLRREKAPADYISDIRHTYMMEDADFKHYLTRCQEEQAKAGLYTDSPEHCPLLVAEHLQTQAEHILVDAMEPTTGITFDQIMASGHSLENLKKYLNLTLRMMAQFCHEGPEILAQLGIVEATHAK